jgi:DNA processing protein
MDEHALEAWFRLAHTPGISRAAARVLLRAFGSPQAVFDAPAKAWREVVPPKVVTALIDPPADHLPRWLVARDWLQAGEHRQIICLGDAAYPDNLLHTEDPPLLMYADGQTEALQAPALAIVGSRNPTPEGARNARAFAHSLASEGWAVVSGLARGIDASAHEGALEAGGITIAIIGTGPDLAYPAAHQGLMRRIADSQGLVLSEYSPGTPPVRAHFPQRNRLIAGLAKGTLVVEAALQSGSLITARLASEAGREVFAIPGSIHSPLSKGCHALIQQGAKLAQTAQDVIEELQGGRLIRVAAPGGASAPAAGAGAAAVAADTPGDGADAPPDDPLLRALGWEPVALDTLCQRTGWPVAELSARLLEHELTGHVTRHAGGLYQRTRRA